MTRNSVFSDWLRAALAERGWSVRKLAKEMDPGDIERPRRALYRYLNDRCIPTEPYAEDIARALGVPVESLPLGEPDE